MKIKVLVVEDDDHLRAVVLQAAPMEGYQGVAVSSVEAARVVPAVAQQIRRQQDAGGQTPQHEGHDFAEKLRRFADR